MQNCWKCNTPDEISNRVCVPNKTEDLNLIVFDIITGINDQNFKNECKFDGRKNCEIMRSVSLSVKILKT